MSTLKVVLIGAGNVGQHLGKALHQQGINIVQVFSRKITKARRLAKVVEAAASNQLSELNTQADLYILAVHDDAIAPVAQQIPLAVQSQKLLVHTSGAISASIFKGICKRYGIFYPLQTFSVDRPVDFANIPICINANRKKDRELLTGLGKRLSQKVHTINDQQKAVLHVAAVFVNNFSNQLYTIGEAITQEEGISFDLLRPLIAETAAKVQDRSPIDMQTGPAKRGDIHTIQQHLTYLAAHPDWENLYRQLSKSIHPKLDL